MTATRHVHVRMATARAANEFDLDEVAAGNAGSQTSSDSVVHPVFARLAIHLVDVFTKSIRGFKARLFTARVSTHAALEVALHASVVGGPQAAEFVEPLEVGEKCLRTTQS